MLFSLETLDPKSRHNLLSALIVPRPIAWVTSHDEFGRLNAAPFSFFNLMSGNPPVLCIGIGARDGQPKDTARNITKTRDFVVNLVSEQLVSQMNATAADFAEEVDEAAAVGLALAPSVKVAPPRLAECPASLECRSLQIVDLGTSRTIVIAEVLAVHVQDAAIVDAERCYVDTPSMALVGRMHGGGYYARTKDIFAVKRILVEEFLERPAQVDTGAD